MKICVLCGHTEIFPDEFEKNDDVCPMCEATAEFIKEVEDEDEDGAETWKS